MRDFNSLAIWQQSHALTLKIYSVSHNFPKQEIYGLTSQNVVPVHQYLLTLRKDVVDPAMSKCAGFWSYHLAQHLNCITN